MRCEYHDLIKDMLGDSQPPATPKPEAEPYIFGLRPATRPATRPAAPPPAVPSARGGDENFQRAVQRLELDLQEIESLLRELLSLRAAPPAKRTPETQSK